MVTAMNTAEVRAPNTDARGGLIHLRPGDAAPWDIDAAAKDRKRGAGADNYSVGKDLEDAPHAVSGRIVRVSRGVGDGGSAEPGFVGKGAAPQSPLYALRRCDAAYPASDSAGAEGFNKYG